MQGVSAWAVVDVGISISVCSSGVIRGSMPSITFTSIVVVTVMRSIVNSQVKQHEAVTTVFVCCQEGGGSSAGEISAAMP